MGKQDLVSGETWGDLRSHINSNFTEMYENARGNNNLNLGSHILFEDNFDDLSKWTADSGVSVANNVCSIIDEQGGAVGIYLLQDTDDPVFPINRKYMIEFTSTIESTQKEAVYLYHDSVMQVYSLNGPFNGSMDVYGEISGTEACPMTNQILEAPHKTGVLVDPVNGYVSFYGWWEDSVSGLERISLIGTAQYDPENYIDKIRLSSGGIVTGWCKFEDVKIYIPWACVIGDSIASGRPGHSPVPGIIDGDNPKSCMAYWLEQATGGSRIVTELGIGGNQVSSLLARRNADILPFDFEIVFINIGTNDANSYVDMDISKEKLATTVDFILIAGSTVVINNIAPNAELTSAENLWKETWNTWLSEFCADRENCIMVDLHDTFENTTTVNTLKTAYNADSVHWTTLGYRTAANLIWDALTA